MNGPDAPPLKRTAITLQVMRQPGSNTIEVTDAVRDTLLADMDSAEIVAATQNLDADEIADLALQVLAEWSQPAVVEMNLAMHSGWYFKSP